MLLDELKIRMKNLFNLRRVLIEGSKKYRRTADGALELDKTLRSVELDAHDEKMKQSEIPIPKTKQKDEAKNENENNILMSTQQVQAQTDKEDEIKNEPQVSQAKIEEEKLKREEQTLKREEEKKSEYD